MVSGNREWTPEQRLAIEVKSKNVLVSAAAGTGKTAVLVERIIRQVLSKDISCDIERLLVVTFTEKAAIEVKDRIRTALREASESEPLDERVQRQISLMDQAQISTIHSFCLSVIRRYFYLVDLEPTFRVLDSHEAELLRLEALDDVFERWYQEDSGRYETFVSLVEMYGGSGVDEELKSIVLRLYDFAKTQPSADGWLEEAYDWYENLAVQIGRVLEEDDKSRLYHLDGILLSLPWSRVLMDALISDVNHALSYSREAERICCLPYGPQHYLPVISEEVSNLEKLSQLANEARTVLTGLDGNRGPSEEFARLQEQGIGILGSIREIIGNFQFTSLPTKKISEVSEELQEKAKEYRNAYKREFRSAAKNVLMRPSSELLQEIAGQAPYVRCLIDLVLELDKEFAEKKKLRGGVDFSDLEVYCLSILKQDDQRLAREIGENFDYVFVDEYQDTNPIQEEIISLVSQESNLFMVGDIKQSIYRFRLAEPRIFLEKYRSFQHVSEDCYVDSSSCGARVDLSKNFRSRKEVIDAVNYIFENIMKKEVAEIDYTDDSRLNLGARYPDVSGDCSLAAEVLLIERQNRDGSPNAIEKQETGDGSIHNAGDSSAFANTISDVDDTVEEYESLEKEALVMASKINQLVGPHSSFLVWDSEQSRYRNCTYKDIAVLMRATKDRANVVMDIFQKCGIPVYSELGTGYFRAREIEVSLSILSVVDNPRQDIPLAAVLRSPVVGLSPRDIAIIKALASREELYDSLKDFSVLWQDPENAAFDRCVGLKIDRSEVISLSKTVSEFLDQIESWRTMFRRVPLAHALWTVLKETGYYDYAGGLPGGSQRQANLRALVNRAMDFDGFGRHGLFRFLRFIERIQESEGDLGTARALGESEDVVQVLSVHRAKGLEFPVVFVADLGKKFNMQDLRPDILFHKDLGIGAVFSDLGCRIKYPTLAYQANKSQILKDNLAEEMRILYVAMTRAKEKLYLVGSANNLEKELHTWHKKDISSAQTYLDWIVPLLLREVDSRTSWRTLEIPEDIPFKLELYGVEGGGRVPEPFARTSHESSLKWNDLKNLSPLSSPPDEAVFSEVKRRLEWNYGYKPFTSTPAKMSVGELKSRFILDEEAIQFVPSPTKRLAFTGRKGPTGVERGVAVHALLARINLDLPMSETSIKNEIERLSDTGFLVKEHILDEDVSMLSKFFRSPTGRMLLASPERVRREVPFTMRLDVEMVEEAFGDAARVVPIFEGGIHGESQEFSDRKDYIVVQGIIDVLIENQGGLTILDYKTDSITLDELLSTADIYAPQIALYSHAAEVIFARSVLRSVICFLTLGKEVEIDWRNYLKGISGVRKI